MKRIMALMVCLAMLLACIPVFAAVEERIPDIDAISMKILEWCMMEHMDSIVLYIEAKGLRGLSDDDIFYAICDAMDEYCREDYKIARSKQSDGSLRVSLSNIHLRPGLLIAEAYWNGKTNRLTSDEKKCLKQLTEITDQMVRKYGYATIDTELAIYDYICEHVEYRTYPSGDSRRVKCTSAANAFLYGWGNCQAYSDLFYLMTMMTGFDTGFVSGTMDGDAHLWNTISINGSVVMVDVTYGDNKVDVYPLPSHYYFNFGMDRTANRTWYKQVCDPKNLLQKTIDSYSYYSNKNSRYGKAVSSVSDAAKHCVTKAKNHQKYFELLIKGSKVSAKALDAAIKKALGSTQANWNYNYLYYGSDTLIRFRWNEYKNKKMW